MMVKKYLFILLFTAVFWSCGDEQTLEVDTISMEDLMGDSSSVIDSSLTILKDTVVNIPNSDFGRLTFSFLNTFDTLPLKVGHSFDRFGYSQSNKISFIEKSNLADSLNLDVVNLYQYYFTDSLKLNNAFYNWLDCFSKTCTELKINQNESGFSSNPEQIIIYDTIAVFTEYSNSDAFLNHNSMIMDTIKKNFGNDYRYKLQLNQKGDLSW
jgi:hypothetical protein